jgi:hypothetical protein
MPSETQSESVGWWRRRTSSSMAFDSGKDGVVRFADWHVDYVSDGDNVVFLCREWSAAHTFSGPKGLVWFKDPTWFSLARTVILEKLLPL